MSVLTPEQAYEEAVKAWIKAIEAIIKQMKDGVVSPVDPTAPVETGSIKPGGWGANPDPNTWKVVSMTKAPNIGLWKLVDQKNINAVEKFSTEDTAKEALKRFIAAYKPIDPIIVPDIDSNNVDKFGVQILGGTPTGNINYNHSNNDRDDGKRMDFNNPGNGSHKNFEVTGYFKFPDNNAPDDEVSGKSSVKSHSGSNSVKCIDMGVSIKDGKSRWRFEDPHPDYTATLDTGTVNAKPLQDKFLGYKFSRVDVGDGKMRLQIWQDTGNNEGDKPANQWVKLFDFTNTKYYVGDYPEGNHVTIRVDGSNVVSDMEFKWLSDVELKPTPI